MTPLEAIDVLELAMHNLEATVAILSGPIIDNLPTSGGDDGTLYAITRHIESDVAAMRRAIEKVDAGVLRPAGLKLLRPVPDGDAA